MPRGLMLDVRRHGPARSSPCARRGDGSREVLDRALAPDGQAWGTYVHGLFDHGGMRRAFANWLGGAEGLPPAEGLHGPPAAAARAAAYDRLTVTLRQHLDVAALRSLLHLPSREEVIPTDP